MDMFSLKGKNAWVTGGAYGIGFAIARAFVRAGESLDDGDMDKISYTCVNK